MCNHNLGMSFHPRFDAASLPIPENNVALAIPAAYPLSIRRESHLTRITSNGVSREPLLAILAKVICTIYQNLVIKRLGRKVFFWTRIVKPIEIPDKKSDTLDGCSVTAGMECMCGSAMYLITTGISKSQALIVLSSEVVTKRRFSSTNVIVFTGPRCWSYSCVISPEFISYCSPRVNR